MVERDRATVREVIRNIGSLHLLDGRGKKDKGKEKGRRCPDQRRRRRSAQLDESHYPHRPSPRYGRPSSACRGASGCTRLVQYYEEDVQDGTPCRSRVEHNPSDYVPQGTDCRPSRVFDDPPHTRRLSACMSGNNVPWYGATDDLRRMRRSVSSPLPKKSLPPSVPQLTPVFGQRPQPKVATTKKTVRFANPLISRIVQEGEYKPKCKDIEW